MSVAGITVVIANFNRCADLREALASVRRQDYPRVATVVVDNASTDGSQEMLAAEFPEVETVALDENRGMAGYSIGFERAESELLFQMDNDSLMPDPQVLSEVVRRFEQGPPELAAEVPLQPIGELLNVGPRVVVCDGLTSPDSSDKNCE